MIWNTIAEMLVAIGTFALASFTAYNVHMSSKEIKIKYYTEKIESFYLPLINILTSSNLKCRDTYENLNRIIKEKEYLAESKTQQAFPSEESWRDESFSKLKNTDCMLFMTQLLVPKSGQDYAFIIFSDKKFFYEWKNFANALWEDYVNVLKKLNKLKGINMENEPKKPEWYLKLYSTNNNPN